MNLCLIRNLPYIQSDYAAKLIGIEKDVLMEFIDDVDLYSIHLVKLRGRGYYLEIESFLQIIKVKMPLAVYNRVSQFLTAQNCRRKLTAAQKQEVAARQDYLCKLCNTLLKQYEVDHIEEHSVRANDNKSNLQALCGNCHRQKGREAMLRGDSLFEDYIPTKNVFSKYFYD